MTAVIAVKIGCDNCDVVSPITRKAAWVARAVLSRCGWHRNNGVDICPVCWLKGVRGPKTKGQWARRMA